jgi:hypothetical protein
MKAKLVVEGKEFDIEILDPKLQELIAPKKKTGYERLESHCDYWAEDEFGVCQHVGGEEDHIIDEIYKNANYYSSDIVADNNFRADKLMRQLRRFAVECRTKDNPTEKYYIHYVKQVGLQIMRSTDRYIGPWFDTMHNAVKAIEAFKDELIWYFTEYRDSL